MADERCVFPGDTPRTPGRWLNRETAERLLSGESLETVDAADRDRAERLAKTLDSLSVEPSPGDGELPGEAAALAAFRKVRAERADDRAAEHAPGNRTVGRSVSGHRTRVPSADGGLVRIGGPDTDPPRPHRGRAWRLGLAAALTVGMVGGVAAAVGIGFLPEIGGTGSDPAATVSAAATPDRPLVSPSPSGPPAEPRPDGGESDTGRKPPRDTAREGSASPGTGTGTEDRSKRPGAWRGAPSACRDVRDGKNLDADRRRTLEGAAGGPSLVKEYCAGLLTRPGSADGRGNSSDNDVRNGGVRRDDRDGGEGGDKGRDRDQGRDRDRGGDGSRNRDDRYRHQGKGTGFGGHPLGHLGNGSGIGNGSGATGPAKSPADLQFSKTSNFFADRV